VSAVLDTNVLVRHLTADPPDQAARATAFLAGADELLLSDIVVAELGIDREAQHPIDQACGQQAHLRLRP